MCGCRTGAREVIGLNLDRLTFEVLLLSSCFRSFFLTFRFAFNFDTLILLRLCTYVLCPFRPFPLRFLLTCFVPLYDPSAVNVCDRFEDTVCALKVHELVES